MGKKIEDYLFEHPAMVLALLAIFLIAAMILIAYLGD